MFQSRKSECSSSLLAANKSLQKLSWKEKRKQMYGEVLVKHIAKTKSAISELPFHY